MKPKILFSNPPHWEMEMQKDGRTLLRQGIRSGSRWPFTRYAMHQPDAFAFGGYLPAPFFLMHAASYTAKETGADVQIRDSIARGESYQTFLRELLNEAPDFMVIEAATPTWAHDEDLIRQLHKLKPEIKVIVAGTLDERKASDALAIPNVVAVVRGEFDKQIAKVIGGARGVIDHDLLTLEEMNAAPDEGPDEFAISNYFDACPIGSQGPQLQLLTSRGCPFKCIFCVWPAVMTGNDPDGTKPRRVRHYAPEVVERRIRALLAYGERAGRPFRQIYLDDDTFNLSEKHTLAIAEVMGRIGLPWSAMCRADTCSDDAWRAMKKAGCFGVKLGFESGSQRVIDQIVNKALNLEDAFKTAIFLAQELKLSVHGTFTVGLPGETPQEREETKRFIARGYVEGAWNSHQLSGTAEIDGTPLHTLREAGALAKFPGAKLEVGAPVEADGQKKIEAMRAQ